MGSIRVSRKTGEGNRDFCNENKKKREGNRTRFPELRQGAELGSSGRARPVYEGAKVTSL